MNNFGVLSDSFTRYSPVWWRAEVRQWGNKAMNTKMCDRDVSILEEVGYLHTKLLDSWYLSSYWWTIGLCCFPTIFLYQLVNRFSRTISKMAYLSKKKNSDWVPFLSFVMKSASCVEKSPSSYLSTSAFYKLPHDQPEIDFLKMFIFKLSSSWGKLSSIVFRLILMHEESFLDLALWLEPSTSLRASNREQNAVVFGLCQDLAWSP